MYGLHKCFPVFRKNLCRSLREGNQRRSFSFTHNEVDITGNLVNVTRRMTGVLDEAVMNMITSQGDAIEPLDNVIESDGNCGLAHCLLAHELQRQSSLNPNCQNKIKNSLLTLEKMKREGKLNQRETFIAAAAANIWHGGQYSLAGTLLESSLMQNPHDAIVIRLAQHAYLRAGDSKNSLGCVMRCLHVLDNGHILYGHIQGMLAMGFLECGRFAEAEEMGKAAISRTRGKDLWALQALLGVHHITGHSSEVLAAVDEYESYFEMTGTHVFDYYKGMASVQRGNCSGALKCFQRIIQNIRTLEDKVDTEMLICATLLLWQISLNKMDKHTYAAWHRDDLVVLWRRFLSPGVLGVGARSPLVDLCATMAHAAHSVTTSDSRLLPDEATATSNATAPSSSLWAWMQGAPASTSGDQAKPTSPFTAALNSSASSSSSSSSSSASVIGSSKVGGGVWGAKESAVWLREHLEGLGSGTGDVNDTEALVAVRRHSEAVAEALPALLAVKPTMRLNTSSSFSPSSSTSSSSVVSGSSASPLIFHRSPVHPRVAAEVNGALRSFVEENFLDAATVLNAHLPVAQHFGGSIIQRQVLEQTLIEAFMRNDQLQEAQMMLCERAVLYPHDGQSWRRLAAVFGQTGREDLARIAHYTSWQLGIGQGGFGGPT